MATTAILLGTYNGARHLPAQLDSIAAQTADWQLIASDDGSTDATGTLLQGFAARYPERVTVRRGPGRGFAANFLSMLPLVPAGMSAAFCDQDDVWYADKVSRADAALAASAGPALYAARTRLVDDALDPIGLSRGLSRPPGFGNALVQNIASGNTMVLNPAGVAALTAALADGGAPPLHDWWAYQMITGIGGRVLFDPEPAMDYRQHGSNQIGAGRGPVALARRGLRLLRGQSRGLMASQAAALAASAARLTPTHRAQLAALQTGLAARSSLATARAMRRAGVYRQGFSGDAVFWTAVALGRL
ncbi:glycosyltransferase family 2 protein [Paracoccus suum]|uniref:Glycosyltransferase family 2 protein n=1 Tax=Paracoccus suum TaxID=2259340 RepID=A0A344PHI8_9RHOB|nr:glycosyltransferase family 2 protein [Paracoccus suum]AXC48843.1 glycosyltransferase family 2 protein [Paracoccus suum]